MEQYEEHGLTRQEDDIIGSFGESEDFEEVGAQAFTPEHLKAFSSLVRKGLLDRKHDENENVTYVLTPKGQRLWNTRAHEETSSPVLPPPRPEA